MLLQIVYISTARIVLPDFQVDAILRTSRLNNAAHGITGLLVVGGRRFLQALEGPSEAVAQTFERIKRDARHFAVVPLSIKEVTGREFGDWSMGFERGGPDAEPGLKGMVAELVAPLADENLAAQFNGFAEIHARAA